MASFEEIDQARKLLGLGEFATLKEIKRAYREMAFHHHPDRSANEHGSGDEELMKKLNRAYKMLVDYTSRYKYSFKEEDVDRAYPDEEYLKRYVYGWFDGI